MLLCFNYSLIHAGHHEKELQYNSSRQDKEKERLHPKTLTTILSSLLYATASSKAEGMGFYAGIPATISSSLLYATASRKAEGIGFYAGIPATISSSMPHSSWPLRILK